MYCRVIKGEGLGFAATPWVPVPHAKSLRNLTSICLFAGLIDNPAENDAGYLEVSDLYLYIPKELQLKRLMLAGFTVSFCFEDAAAAFGRLEEYWVVGHEIDFAHSADITSLNALLSTRGLILCR